MVRELKRFRAHLAFEDHTLDCAGAIAELEEVRLRAFLGGLGLGTSLLYDYAPPGVEPFSPDNPLIFTSAPLVGTNKPTENTRSRIRSERA